MADRQPPNMTPTPSKYQNFRQPGTPMGANAPSRQPSIVELLSTPPPIQDNPTSGEQNEQPPLSPGGIDLSRNASQSSQSSQNTQNTASTREAPPQRDWQDIRLIELIESAKLIFIHSRISVEEAFNTLQKHNLTSLPVEEYTGDPNCLTFDYTDLNAYLLLVLGKLNITEQSFANVDYYKSRLGEVTTLIEKAKRGEQVPVKFVIQLAPKNPFYKLPESETLLKVVEILGTGVHRIAIYNEDSGKITGILSQRRLIRYFWDNARRFPTLQSLFSAAICDLNIGNNQVISVYGDEPLINALVKMHTDKISSVAVVDRHMNLLGNISVTDVKHVTKSSQSPLLHRSCLHFVSVILNLRGLEDGKDSFPIFHVTSHTSLSRTLAKLVATKAHRLWVVRPYSQGSSASAPQTAGSGSSAGKDSSNPLTPETEGRAGKLVGVISLTDIIGLIARKHSKIHIDPNQARNMRRRSSSSASSRSSTSLDQFRRSLSSASHEFRDLRDFR